MRIKFANQKYVSDYYLKINFKETKTKKDIYLKGSKYNNPKKMNFLLM